MHNKTPFLRGFPTALFGRPKASAQKVLERKRARLLVASPAELSRQLAEVIPPELVESFSKSIRNRVYSQVIVFWAFLSQVLGEDASCAKAVAQVQSWFRQRELPIPSGKTGSYTKARQKLPESMLEGVGGALVISLNRALGYENLWRGHVIKAVDGSSTQLPETEANLKDYPQHSNQKPGCGYPTMQLAALLNLCHGGWEQVITSRQDEHDLNLMGLILPHIAAGNVLLADRAYCSWELIVRLWQQEAFIIARHHQTRKLDFRKATKLGPNERLAVWEKPQKQPRGSKLSAEQWAQMPQSLTVRIVRARSTNREGKKQTIYLVTTLLDARKYPAEEIAQLYCHRWEIELRFRDLKTTMGMEKLRTKTPAMARKEVLMYLIAYNAIRLLMLRAAQMEGTNHRRISYKGALQVLQAWSTHFAANKPSGRYTKLRAEMLAEIANRSVPDRPGRSEPREVKTRPKSYPRLTTPRPSHPHHFANSEYPGRILDQAA